MYSQQRTTFPHALTLLSLEKEHDGFFAATGEMKIREPLWNVLAIAHILVFWVYCASIATDTEKGLLGGSSSNSVARARTLACDNRSGELKFDFTRYFG